MSLLLRTRLKPVALALFLAGLSATSSAQVVISQVYGGGGNSGATFSHDFVELRNTSSAPVSLSGWSLQYASTSGSTWGNRVNLSGSIPANGFFLVRLRSANVATGTPLTSFDQDGGNSIDLAG
ncbi:MAG: lamin tail domain-containing protein, partial [Burkholderiales bacterium]